jgi:hypothetical protein
MSKRRRGAHAPNEEEEGTNERRKKYDNASFADASLGGAFNRPGDRGSYGDLSRGGRPKGANYRWAAEPERKRHVDGYTPQMWEWFREISEQLRKPLPWISDSPEWFRECYERDQRLLRPTGYSPKTLPVSHNIKEGKRLGKRARNQKIAKHNPAAGYIIGNAYARVNGRRVYCNLDDRCDGYDPKIYDSRIGSLRDESYSSDKFGDDSGGADNDWREHSSPAMDDDRHDDSSFSRSSRQPAPDGNEWCRTGRRGRKSYLHPVDRDDRPKARKPDWHDLEPLFKPVWEMIDDVLRKDERHAFVQRYLHGATYDQIARTSRPKLSDRAQARRLVKKARKKLEARFGKKVPNPFAETSQGLITKMRTSDIV